MIARFGIAFLLASPTASLAPNALPAPRAALASHDDDARSAGRDSPMRSIRDHVTPDDLASLAAMIDAPRYYLVRHDAVEVTQMGTGDPMLLLVGAGGGEQHAGELLAPARSLTGGLIANVGRDAAYLRGSSGFEYVLNPGELMVVGSFMRDDDPPIGGISLHTMCCLIDCPPGYYACCNCTGGNPPCTCACVKNGTAASCGTGGSGSPKCEANCP